MRYLAMLLCAWVGLATAEAQEAGAWRHPSGAYTLSYDESSWRIGRPYSYAGRTTSVTIGPRRSSTYAECMIFEYPIPELSAIVDQNAANRAMESYSAERWPRALGFRERDVRFFASEMLSHGIRIATLIADSPRDDHLRTYYRAFILALPNGGVLQEISCSTVPSAGNPHIESIARLLDSLRFERAPTP